MRTVYFQFFGIVMGVLLTLPLFSQSVGINDDGSQPNTAAILDIKSTNKGLLIPRTDTTTINTQGTPPNGLIIYQTLDDVFYYYDGSRWKDLSTGDIPVFERNGSLIRQKGNVDYDDFILGRDALPTNGVAITDTFLLFDKSKGAFRFGRLHGSKNWSSDSIGFASFAYGFNPKASGRYATAMGIGVEAPSYNEFVIGGFNTPYVPNDQESWNDNDRLFVIGNGNSYSNQKDALIVLKNGNTTLKGELTLTDGTSPYTLPNTDGNALQVLSTDGAGVVTWIDNTSSGVFERDGTLIRQKDHVDDDDFIFGRDVLPENGIAVSDTFFYYDQSKGAFRLGRLHNSSNGSVDSTGFGSFALGYNSKTKGLYALAWGTNTEATNDYSTAWGSASDAWGEKSTAWGENTKASGARSTAWGIETEATNSNSTAWGNNAKALGMGSTTWGYFTEAPSALETTLGYHNTPYVPISATQWNSNDRLFVIGNGTSPSNTSNALTMLKNGNTTLKGELTLTDGTSPYTLPNTDGTADQVLSTDGSGTVTWADGDSKGVFEREGNLIRQKDNINDDFIFGRDAMPANGESVTSAFFFFDQSKSAFRGGMLFGSNNWSPDSIGSYSFAFGVDTKAKGQLSASWGEATKASGTHSTAWGNSTEAKKNLSTAWGGFTSANGIYSTAWGCATKAQSAYETVLGRYNTDYTPNSTSAWNDNDRLFVIGNGNISFPNNALTILKNGCMGLQNENTPSYALQLPNNSSHDIGKGLAYEWYEYSDARVKSKQKALDYGLSEVMQLSPKSYFQHNSRVVDEVLVIDPKNGKNNIGLIAQKVYDIIPEVVNKPADENVELWGMNYEKLVPVLINAIQEQQQMIKQLEQSQLVQEEKIEKLLAEKQTMK